MIRQIKRIAMVYDDAAKIRERIDVYSSGDHVVYPFLWGSGVWLPGVNLAWINSYEKIYDLLRLLYALRIDIVEVHVGKEFFSGTTMPSAGLVDSCNIGNILIRFIENTDGIPEILNDYITDKEEDLVELHEKLFPFPVQTELKQTKDMLRWDVLSMGCLSEKVVAWFVVCSEQDNVLYHAMTDVDGTASKYMCYTIPGGGKYRIMVSLGNIRKRYLLEINELDLA